MPPISTYSVSNSMVPKCPKNLYYPDLAILLPVFKIKFLFISADETILHSDKNPKDPVSGEWSIEKLKKEIGIRLKKETFSIYFHKGVEIEFDDETLLGQLFGPEIIIAQVDIFIPSAALVAIKSEKNFEILTESGEILSLEAGPENLKTVDLKRIGIWVSLSKSYSIS